MKKKFLFATVVACVFLLQQEAHSQCMPWYTSGNLIGPTGSGPSILGTLDANSIFLTADNTQVGIISGAGATGPTGITGPTGSFEIGINGTNPQNKLLIENGAISSNPYSDLTGLGFGLLPSDVGVYSYSNNTSSGNNIGAVSDINGSRPINVGSLNLVNNGSLYNLGFLTYVNSTITGTSNTGIGITVSGTGTSVTNHGADITVTGGNSNNQGMDIKVSGSTSENDGAYALASGAASVSNVGLDGVATGSTATNYLNPQGNIGVFGNANNPSGSGFVVNAINSAIKGYAYGDESYNQGFLGGATGNTGAINVGFIGNVNGNSNNNWAGPGSSILTPATGATGAGNFGMVGSVYGQNNVNVGGYSAIIETSGSSDNNAGSTTYGLIGACGANTSGTVASQVGVLGYVTNYPSSSAYNYGVMGSVPVSSLVSSVTFAGYFEGDVFTTSHYYPSDIKLKENIRDYSGALDALNRLPIKRYNFKNTEYPNMKLPQGEQIGVLSVDMKNLFPNLVKAAVHPAISKGDKQVTFDAVNYNALIPVLVQAVKELDTKTDSVNTASNPIFLQQQQQIALLTSQLAEQGTQLTELKSMINDICNLGCAGLQNSNGNNQDVVLFQSIPNPTSGSATIGYVINIPFSAASIVVTSTDGISLQEFKISQSGKGSVTFQGSQFSSGTYWYSLYINDKLYDTKTIVIAKD